MQTDSWENFASDGLTILAGAYPGYFKNLSFEDLDYFEAGEFLEELEAKDPDLARSMWQTLKTEARIQNGRNPEAAEWILGLLG